MLQELRSLFENLVGEDGRGADAPDAIELATAVLLVEVMRSDRERTPAERDAVLGVLQRSFPRQPPELERLLQRAEDASRQANDYFAFTSVINDRLTQPQKIALVEALWQVAYADGHPEAEEMHTISKVAGLLHVTHGEYIAAKLRAKEATGAGGDALA